jgi:DNA polymerase-3 subunit beta
MKLKTRQEVLARALNYAAKAASQKPNIPVLSNILLTANREHLQLSATNLDMGINVWVGAVVDEDGKVTASAKFLADFIAAAGGERVDISTKDETLKVVSDTAKAEFQTIPASEFPILPKAEGEPLMVMKSVDFVSALEKVIFACATDVTTSKIQFTGVLFELAENDTEKLTLIGLNGFRMSKKVASATRTSSDALQLIVPARPLQEFVRIVHAEDSEEVKMYLSGNKSQLIFQLDDLEFSVRLLEGPYPDYRSVLPKEHNYSFDVSRADFERALKVVNTFARSSFGSRVLWDLDIESSTLLLHTAVTDLGTNEVRIPVQNVSGIHDLKDAYGLQSLIEMVSHMHGDLIHFETKEPLLPAVFTENTSDSFLHLIMPMARED